jgi:hypothetical protein
MARFSLVVAAVTLCGGADRAGAGQQQATADPPMSAAVFEDVPSPMSVPTPLPVPVPAAATPTIATVTLQPPAVPETPVEDETGAVSDPAKDIAGSIRFDDLPNQVGARVRVLTRGQRLHRGVVLSADSKQVTLTVSQRGGSATYILPREQIERIDPS